MLVVFILVISVIVYIYGNDILTWIEKVLNIGDPSSPGGGSGDGKKNPDNKGDYIVKDIVKDLNMTTYEDSLYEKKFDWDGFYDDYYLEDGRTDTGSGHAFPPEGPPFDSMHGKNLPCIVHNNLRDETFIGSFSMDTKVCAYAGNTEDDNQGRMLDLFLKETDDDGKTIHYKFNEETMQAEPNETEEKIDKCITIFGHVIYGCDKEFKYPSGQLINKQMQQWFSIYVIIPKSDLKVTYKKVSFEETGSGFPGWIISRESKMEPVMSQLKDDPYIPDKLVNKKNNIICSDLSASVFGTTRGDNNTCYVYGWLPDPTWDKPTECTDGDDDDECKPRYTYQGNLSHHVKYIY